MRYKQYLHFYIFMYLADAFIQSDFYEFVF